jgi:hypothetical protein
MPTGSKGRIPVWLIVLTALSIVFLTIVVLVSVGLYLGKKAIDSSHGSIAQSDITGLILAVDMFYDEYGKIPTPAASGPGDYGTETKPGLMNMLVGFDKTANPKGLRFFNARSATGKTRSTAHNGLFYNPGGSSVELFTPFRPKTGSSRNQHYFLILDTDYDGMITGPHGRKISGKRAIAWSVGPDGRIHPNPKHRDNQDNVYSW